MATKQFSELVGQDHVVKTLGNSIEIDRIAHAYLFVGPRGTGKTTSARLFAKSLNWEDGPSLNVPEDSEIGKSIMEGRCLDVIEIDGASNNSVDQVRDLRDECQYAPVQCRFKIYVIDEVHMLSQAAFNALLKTLEEPPPHVKFIFATTESHKVLPTIVSRCQRFEFRSIPKKLISDKLREICLEEKIQAEDPALEAISRMAMGGMRDAQSILDQMISFCGSSISQEDVLEVYGIVSDDRINQLALAVLRSDFKFILDETEAFLQEGLDFYRALLDLSSCFREILIQKVKDNKDAIYPEQIVRILDSLREGEEMVRFGLSEKANFEVTLFRAVESGKSRSIDQVIRKISSIFPEGEKKKTNPSEINNSQNSFPLKSSVEFVPKKTVQADNSRNSLNSSGTTDEILEDEELSSSEKSKDSSSSEEFQEKDIRQIKDETRIGKRVDELPEELRKLLIDEYKVNFVAIEKIDPKQLI